MGIVAIDAFRGGPIVEEDGRCERVVPKIEWETRVMEQGDVPVNDVVVVALGKTHLLMGVQVRPPMSDSPRVEEGFEQEKFPPVVCLQSLDLLPKVLDPKHW